MIKVGVRVRIIAKSLKLNFGLFLGLEEDLGLGLNLCNVKGKSNCLG